MNEPMPDTLHCLDCGAVIETAMILDHPSEFIIEGDVLHCPICSDGILRDTSTLNQAPPAEDWSFTPDAETSFFRVSGETGVVLYEESYMLGTVIWRYHAN